MQELQIFNYESKELRTVEVNGEVFWVAKDVCDILELSDVSKAIAMLDDDEVTIFNMGGLSGAVYIINESGLYNLIIRSDKPNSKAFKKWVICKIIPVIRALQVDDKSFEKITNEVARKVLKTIESKKYIYGKTNKLYDIKDEFEIIEEGDQFIVVDYKDLKFSIRGYNGNWTISEISKNNDFRQLNNYLMSKKKALEWIVRNF